MSATSVAATRGWLRGKHVSVAEDWLEACVAWIFEESQGIGLTQDQVNLAVYNQWLVADLHEIQSPSIPPEVLSQESITLTGSYSVQIDSLRDISQPCYSQLERITGAENENSSVAAFDKTLNRTWQPSSTRVLLLSLSDGILNDVQAFEYQPIPSLSVDLPSGTKAVLKGPLLCRSGMMLLTAANITLLGGEVEALRQVNSQKAVLQRALNMTGQTGGDDHGHDRKMDTKANAGGVSRVHASATACRLPVGRGNVPTPGLAAATAGRMPAAGSKPSMKRNHQEWDDDDIEIFDDKDDIFDIAAEIDVPGAATSLAARALSGNFLPSTCLQETDHANKKFAKDSKIYMASSSSTGTSGCAKKTMPQKKGGSTTSGKVTAGVQGHCVSIGSGRSGHADDIAMGNAPSGRTGVKAPGKGSSSSRNVVDYGSSERDHSEGSILIEDTSNDVDFEDVPGAYDDFHDVHSAYDDFHNEDAFFNEGNYDDYDFDSGNEHFDGQKDRFSERGKEISHDSGLEGIQALKKEKDPSLSGGDGTGNGSSRNSRPLPSVVKEESPKFRKGNTDSTSNNSRIDGNSLAVNAQTSAGCCPVPGSQAQEEAGTKEKTMHSSRGSRDLSSFNTPPFTYLNHVKTSMSSLKRPTSFVVKAYIRTLLGKLKMSKQLGWSLTACINDGTDALEVSISNEVLTLLIGHSTQGFAQLRKTDEDTAAEALASCQRLLANMSCLMEIEVPQFGGTVAAAAVPCVRKLREVTADDVQLLRSRVSDRDVDGSTAVGST